jgi:elongation factor G
VKECVAALARCAPSPRTGKRRELINGETRKAIDPADSHFVGQVFKVTGDPKSNIKYSVIRILSGQLKADTNLLRGDDRKGQRPGQLHTMLGPDHPDLDMGIAGDIVGLAKVELNMGDVVHGGTPGKIDVPKFPTPMYALAIEPKSRADADKVSTALHRFTDEDPCFRAERDHVTGELVIHGVGDLHLRTILSRMERFFKLQVDTKTPKIPYRETITGKAENIEYTHKKQSGGAGQFGRVIINVLANERGAGYEFVDRIFGGSIDQQFRPSVDKGIRSVLTEVVIAGYPVVDVKVELIDGKTHPVDSKDIAFQIAGREAFKIGFEKAKPVLLEPIVNLEVTIPAERMGDITGDVASRRGRPVGQDMLPGGMAVVKAQVPLSELSDYHSRLSSITGGQGSYSMDLSHYEVVPGNVQQQIIDAAKKARAEHAAAH